MLSSVFASITLPYTQIELPDVPSEGKWFSDNLTDNLRNNIPSFLVKIEDDVLLNSYRYPFEEGFDDDGFFFVLSEFSGMKFVFGWSAVRVMAFKNTRSEVEKAYESHIRNLGGSGLKITNSGYDKKVGEFFYEFHWTDKDGKKVEGRSYGTYYNKETLITMTLEWKTPEAKKRAEKVLNDYVQKLGITYTVNL